MRSGRSSRGERYIHSSVVGLVVDDSLRWLRDGSGLSRREREVLSLLGGGRTPARIGEVLGISVHTVRRHLTNTAAKLGVRGSDRAGRLRSRPWLCASRRNRFGRGGATAGARRRPERLVERASRDLRDA